MLILDFGYLLVLDSGLLGLLASRHQRLAYVVAAWAHPGLERLRSRLELLHLS